MEIIGSVCSNLVFFVESYKFLFCDWLFIEELGCLCFIFMLLSLDRFGSNFLRLFSFGFWLKELLDGFWI